MQRRAAKARRYEGFSWTVSARALIIRAPPSGVLAQDGTRPHFSLRSWRTGRGLVRVLDGAVEDGVDLLGRGHVLVGRQGLLGRPTSRPRRFLRDPRVADSLHTDRTYVPHCQTHASPDRREPPPTMDSHRIHLAGLPSSLWDEVFGSQPDPDPWLVLATLAAALAAVVPHGVWRIARNAITIAHEGGHGLVALLTGRSLSGIRLHSDTSGLTVSRGKPTGLGMILTAAAGYTAPPLLGLGGRRAAGRRATSRRCCGWRPRPAAGDAGDDPQRLRRAHRGRSPAARSCWCPGSPDRRCRRRSRTRWCGSCCSAGCGRRSSSRRSGRAAARGDSDADQLAAADPRPGRAVAVPVPRGRAVLADGRRALAAGGLSAHGAAGPPGGRPEAGGSRRSGAARGHPARVSRRRRRLGRADQRRPRLQPIKWSA